MNIPSEFKVGGKTYSVNQTENIYLGCDYTGECCPQDLEINIRPLKNESVKEIVFLHEMIHAIYFHLGYTDHDEHKVEELANALHMVIMDNPGVFNSKD